MSRFSTFLAVLIAVALLPQTILTTLAQEATPLPGAAVATPVSLAGIDPLPLTAERQGELGAYISSMLATTGVPGASVAVVQNGEVVYLEGFGVRDLSAADPAPVTPDSLMMIGSITKSMTATMAASLVDDGALTWETPVVDLLPEFTLADPELSQKLTIRNAFCACTGVPRNDMDLIFNSAAYPPERLIASVAALPLLAPLGELFQYSNQMFAIGGYAAAVAASGSQDDLYAAYTTAMREHVLDPIGMERSTFDLDAVLASEDYAVAHSQNIAGAYQAIPLAEEDSFVTSVAPAGALWSSAAEMARYLQMELGDGVAPDGARVVSEENLAATGQQQVAIPASPDMPPILAKSAEGYGLGWVLGDYQGQPLIWHGGGTFGFTAQAAFLPDANLGIVVLTNGSNADILTLAVQYRLLELLFNQPESFGDVVSAAIEAEAQGAADVQGRAGTLDAKAIAPYLGSYANDELGEIDAAIVDDALILDVGELHTELTPLLDETGAPSAYVAVDPPLSGAAMTFAQGESGPTLTVIDPSTGEAFVFTIVPGEGPLATPAA